MKTRAQKEESVKVLTDKLNRAKSVVFADYRGLNMSQLSEIRKNLRDQQAEFGVTKNTLLKLALKDSPLQTQDSLLFSGPIATLFSYEDEITPIKTLVKALRDAQIGKIKAGFLGEEYLDEISINQLASLPSKLELQAKVVGVLVTPLQGMVSVLQANLRNLVYALHQIQLQKGGEII